MKNCSILILFAILFGFRPLSADVPALINYQGRIAQPGATGSVNFTITFGLFPSPAGGESLWEEAHPITAVDGLFNVLLGSLDPFPDGLFRQDSLYLSLSTEADGELQPRQQLVSVAYAMRSREAENVAATIISPIGIQLLGSGGAWDSSGVLETPLLKADSLAVGDIPVINSEGRWVGPGNPTTGSALPDTIIFLDLESDVVFFGQDFESVGFDQFVDVEGPATLEFQLHFQAVTNFGFEVRLGYKQVTPINVDLGSIGSISAGQPSSDSFGTTVQTYGLLKNVESGNYRIWVEGRGESNITTVTVIRGLIVIKVYR